MEDMSIKEIHRRLIQKEISAQEIAQLYLDTIKQKEEDLNAFITATPELALEHARAVDAKIAKGENISLLAGIPCALKDAILVEGVRCTAGSKILSEYTASYDATVTKKLRENDAVIVGKTNMDEFGMGGSTENSSFGVTKNPYDLTRVAGGSSGGSAVSVASEETMVALGEDTGGSVRLPASFCGVVGLKPTYGAVSRHGIIALASSFDQVGPFAKTVEDAEIVFQAISGQDELDSTSVAYLYKSHDSIDLKQLKVGVPKEYFSEGLDKEVGKVIKDGLQKLENEGTHIEEISLPHVKYALAAYYIINTSEASSNLARYDGIRYGNAVDSDDLLQTYLQNRGQGLGAEVKRRIMLGTYALSAGYYDAFYLKAQKIRTLLKNDFEEAFQKVDVIMGPVSPILPYKIGEKADDPLAMYLVDVYSVPINLVGLPGISVPAGMANNLPVGMQMISPPFQEDLLFAVGKSFEKLV